MKRINGPLTAEVDGVRISGFYAVQSKMVTVWHTHLGSRTKAISGSLLQTSSDISRKSRSPAGASLGAERALASTASCAMPGVGWSISQVRHAVAAARLDVVCSFRPICPARAHLCFAAVGAVVGTAKCGRPTSMQRSCTRPLQCVSMKSNIICCIASTI